MSDIKLAAPSMEVLVGDEVLTIRPYFFGQLPTVLPLITAISSSVEVFKEDIPLGTMIQAIMASCCEEVVQLLVVATGKPRAWFNTLENDRPALELMTAVVLLNHAQFTKKLMPAVQSLASQLPAMLGKKD